ncbi:hypothetical protein [Ketobacter sp.]|nr:MAG: hypothetical protein D6160_09865 [Ketobacter sp.]
MAHLTVASSENAVIKLFEGIRDNFSVDQSDSADFGPFTAGYEVAFHLEGGDVDLQSDNSIVVSELDIKWDKLRVFAGIDIPELCIGGFCIIPNPFGGCLVRAPRICIFDDDPDIGIDLNLNGLLTSEISLAAKPVLKYYVNPARPPAMNWLDAEDAGLANHWQLFIDPEWVDIDVFDWSDIVGDLLEDALDNAIDGLLFFLPGWAKDLIRAILGPVIDLVRAILDIGDDIDEWLSDLLGVSLGLFDLILTLVADHFAKQYPLLEIEDPFPVIPYQAGLIPVKLPIETLAVTITDDEMILTADVGDTL